MPVQAKACLCFETRNRPPADPAEPKPLPFVCRLLPLFPLKGNDDYALEVFRAMEEVWDGTGMFVFTSSGSVYAETKGGVVTEDSPIDERKVDSPLRSECQKRKKMQIYRSKGRRKRGTIIVWGDEGGVVCLQQSAPLERLFSQV